MVTPNTSPARCDRYVGPDDPPGSLDFPWPIAENRCLFDRGHDGDHFPERDALTQLATPEPEPFRQVWPDADDRARWQEWRDRTNAALRFARQPCAS